MNKRILRAGVMALVCLAVTAAVGCAERDVPSEEPKEVKKVKVEKKKAVVKKAPVRKKAAQPSMLNEKHRYEAYVGVKVRDFGKQLEEAKARSVHTSGRSRERQERAIRDMERKIAEMKASYQKLQKAEGESWQKERAKVDVAIDDVENE